MPDCRGVVYTCFRRICFRLFLKCLSNCGNLVIRWQLKFSILESNEKELSAVIIPLWPNMEETMYSRSLLPQPSLTLRYRRTLSLRCLCKEVVLDPKRHGELLLKWLFRRCRFYDQIKKPSLLIKWQKKLRYDSVYPSQCIIVDPLKSFAFDNFSVCVCCDETRT